MGKMKQVWTSMQSADYYPEFEVEEMDLIDCELDALFNKAMSAFEQESFEQVPIFDPKNIWKALGGSDDNY